MILRAQFPQLPDDTLHRMITFNLRVTKELDDHNFGSRGAPWEYNLRDISRWCEAVVYHFESNHTDDKKYSPESLVDLIYCDRLRTAEDRVKLRMMFVEVFECEPKGDSPVFYVNKDFVYLGEVRVKRNTSACSTQVLNQEVGSVVLRKQLPVLRSLVYCVNMSWMSIVVSITCNFVLSFGLPAFYLTYILLLSKHIYNQQFNTIAQG